MEKELFELLKSFFKNNKQITFDCYAKSIGIKKTKTIQECKRAILRLLAEFGILKDGGIQEFENFDLYLKHLTKKAEEKKLKKIMEWCENSKARKFFVERTPKNKKEELYFSKIECLIDVVEKYYDVFEKKLYGGKQIGYIFRFVDAPTKDELIDCIISYERKNN